MKTNPLKKITEKQNAKGTLDKLIKQISEQETSVRTTFALTKDGETALEWISKHSKKSIKSIINSFCEQLQHTLTNENEDSLGKIIIELFKENPKSEGDKNRRSMVLSKKSLKILNDVEKKYQVPRDVLLDRGFPLVMKLMETSEEIRLEKHRKALSMIDKLWGEMENLEKDLNEFLGDDDPVVYRLGYAIVVLMNLSTAMEEEQKNGTPINPDDM